MIELRVLGALDLKGPEGETLLSVLANSKRVALLAYLAFASPNGFHRRDKLLGLFWAESDQEHGRAALRKALYVLRQSLGEKVVVNRGDEEVGLAAGSVWCDAAAFEQALEGGELQGAVDLYAGCLLDGFHVGGADEFERWLDGERQRLAARYAEALEKLAGRAEAAGQFVSAVGWWQRLAAEDPYNTRVAIRLMEALAAAGDRGNALQWAEQHEHRLRDELGIEPDEELRALVGRLRREPAAAGQATGAGRLREGRSAVADARPVEHEPVEPRRLSPGQVPLGRALATYGLVSLGVLTAVHIFTLQLGLPAWFFQSAVILLFACLPLVVFTALVAGKPPGKSWVSWRNAVGVIALAFVLLGATVSGYMATRSMGIGPWGTLLGQGVLEERDLIVLADFEDYTGDSTLALSLTEAFRVKLAQSPVVKIASRQNVGRVLRRMEKDSDVPLVYDLAREVAIREGLKAVIAGGISTLGSSYVLSVRLVAAETGEELHASLESAADLDAIMPAIDRLTARLRERIGESLKTIRASLPLSQVRTASLEALRLYTKAEQAISTGEYRLACDYVDQAIEIDSTFASAYRTRARCLGLLNTGWAQQVEDMTRAFELRHRLPPVERYIVEASYHLRVTVDLEKRINACQAALELDPEDLYLPHCIGFSYMMLGDYARAEEWFRREVEMDSTAGTGWEPLPRMQFMQGKFDEAEQTLREFEKKVPEHFAIERDRAQFASALGDYKAAEEHIRRIRERWIQSARWRASTSRNLGRLAQVQGRLSEAEGHFRDAMAARQGEDLVWSAVALASMRIWFLGDTAAALELVAEPLERYPLDSFDPLDGPHRTVAGFYTFAGQPDRARAVLTRWEESTPPELEHLTRGDRQLAWAALALVEGRAEAALEELRRATLRGGVLPMMRLPLIGRAHELAGQPDSAVAAYERYLTTPWPGRALNGITPGGGFDLFWLPVVYERLGELYEQRGDTANAIVYYGKLVDLWKDADPELQPRVEAARRAIRALSPDA